jgi:hypothetical protein
MTFSGRVDYPMFYRRLTALLAIAFCFRIDDTGLRRSSSR